MSGGVYVDQSDSAMRASTWSRWGGVRKISNCMRKMYDCAQVQMECGVWCVYKSSQFVWQVPNNIIILQIIKYVITNLVRHTPPK